MHGEHVVYMYVHMRTTISRICKCLLRIHEINKFIKNLTHSLSTFSIKIKYIYLIHLCKDMFGFLINLQLLSIFAAFEETHPRPSLFGLNRFHITIWRTHIQWQLWRAWGRMISSVIRFTFSQLLVFPPVMSCRVIKGERSQVLLLIF